MPVTPSEIGSASTIIRPTLSTTLNAINALLQSPIYIENHPESRDSNRWEFLVVGWLNNAEIQYVQNQFLAAGWQTAVATNYIAKRPYWILALQGVVGLDEVATDSNTFFTDDNLITTDSNTGA